MLRCFDWSNPIQLGAEADLSYIRLHFSPEMKTPTAQMLRSNSQFGIVN